MQRCRFHCLLEVIPSWGRFTHSTQRILISHLAFFWNVLLCSLQIPINGTASSWIDVNDLILQEIIKISYADGQVLSPLSAKEFLQENWGTKPSSFKSKISAPTEVSIRYLICSNQTDSGLQLEVQF